MRHCCLQSQAAVLSCCTVDSAKVCKCCKVRIHTTLPPTPPNQLLRRAISCLSAGTAAVLASQRHHRPWQTLRRCCASCRQSWASGRKMLCCMGSQVGGGCAGGRRDGRAGGGMAGRVAGGHVCLFFRVPLLASAPVTAPYSIVPLPPPAPEMFSGFRPHLPPGGGHAQPSGSGAACALPLR